MFRPTVTSELQVLLSPAATLIVDIFRSLDRFEEHYDLDTLDDLEGRLCGLTGMESAKSLVSDALLLAFAFRSEQPDGLAMNNLGSRRATADEFRLYGLIAAAGSRDHAVAVSCAHRLGLTRMVSTLSHAENIADRLVGAGLRIDQVSSALLDALDVAIEPQDDAFSFAGLVRSRS
jgi:hypothetical protein